MGNYLENSILILAEKSVKIYTQLVLIAVRVHLFPFRTQKLSSPAPKILAWRRAGKIGNANTMKGSGRPGRTPSHIPP